MSAYAWSSANLLLPRHLEEVGWDQEGSQVVGLPVLKPGRSQLRQTKTTDHLKSVPDRGNKKKNKGPERGACLAVSGSSKEASAAREDTRSVIRRGHIM